MISVLPVILGLQELKLVFDPVTRFCHCEFEPGLPGLMRRLQTVRSFSLTQSVTELERYFQAAPCHHYQNNHTNLCH